MPIPEPEWPEGSYEVAIFRDIYYKGKKDRETELTERWTKMVAWMREMDPKQAAAMEHVWKTLTSDKPLLDMPEWGQPS